MKRFDAGCSQNEERSTALPADKRCAYIKLIRPVVSVNGNTFYSFRLLIVDCTVPDCSLNPERTWLVYKSDKIEHQPIDDP